MVWGCTRTPMINGVEDQGFVISPLSKLNVMDSLLISGKIKLSDEKVEVNKIDEIEFNKANGVNKITESIMIPFDVTISTRSEVIIESNISIGGNLFMLPNSTLLVRGSLRVGHTVGLESKSSLRAMSIKSNRIVVQRSTIETNDIVCDSISGVGSITSNTVKTKDLELDGSLEAESLSVVSLELTRSTIHVRGELEASGIRAEFSSIVSKGTINVRGSCEVKDSCKLRSKNLLVGSTLNIGVDTRVVIDGTLECGSVHSPSRGDVEIGGETLVLGDLYMGRGGRLMSAPKFLVNGTLTLDNESIVKVGEIKEIDGGKEVIEKKKVKEVIERKKVKGGNEKEKVKGGNEKVNEEGSIGKLSMSTTPKDGDSLLSKTISEGLPSALIGSIKTGVSYLLFDSGLVVNGDVHTRGCLSVNGNLVVFQTMRTLGVSFVVVRGSFISPCLELGDDTSMEVKGNSLVSNIPPKSSDEIYDLVNPKARPKKPHQMNCVVSLSSNSRLSTDGLDTKGPIRMGERSVIDSRLMIARTSLSIGDPISSIEMGLKHLHGKPVDLPKAVMNVTECLRIDWAARYYGRHINLDGVVMNLGSIVTSGLKDQQKRIDKYKRDGTIRVIGV